MDLQQRAAIEAACRHLTSAYCQATSTAGKQDEWLNFSPKTQSGQHPKVSLKEHAALLDHLAREDQRGRKSIIHLH